MPEIGQSQVCEGATKTTPEVAQETRTTTSPVWHVVVLNDPVNLMSYVVLVFRRVFGYSLERARRHMLEVHHMGQSRLWSGDRESAEAYVHSLQKWQLTAKMEQDG